MLVVQDGVALRNLFGQYLDPFSRNVRIVDKGENVDKDAFYIGLGEVVSLFYVQGVLVSNLGDGFFGAWVCSWCL